MMISSYLILLTVMLSEVPGVFSLLGLISALTSFIAPDALDTLRANRKMEEFIKYLGIPSTDLCHPSTDDNLVPMFNKDLPFGDLILDKAVEEEDYDTYHDFSSRKRPSRKQRRRHRHRGRGKGRRSGKQERKWKDGVIPYYISRDYTSREKEKIEKAISEMNSRLTRVRFRHFRHSDRNYVMIFSGKGCYSKLGKSGGQQPLSLQASKCLNNGVIQHELMHAIGFSHEQNRPDRDDYIKLIFRNIPESWINEYERNNPAQAAYVGDYDYFSVMHYPAQAPRDNEKLAFTVLDEDVDESDIGNKDEMSDLDVEKIDEFYS